MTLLKKFFLYILSLLFIAPGSGVGGGELMEYDKYTLQAYMQPVWEGDIVYNETLMFVEDASGNVPPAPLLYKPDEIISLRSFDLNTEYIQGVDYNVNENGCIVLTENSRIFRWSYQAYYPDTPETGHYFDRTGGGYISFGEGDTYFKTQVAVTYRHSDSWDGKVPGYRGDFLSGTMDKLKNGKKLTIVYYGDSITTGANSSNTAPPFAPIWTQLVTQELTAEFDNPNIVEINTAVGGTNSEWGAENAQERAAAYNPDLVVIGFGMNDAGTSSLKYACNINKIIRIVRKKNKNAEFILVSPMCANKEVKGFYGNQYKFENILKQFEIFKNGVAIAPVWTMHSYLLKKKRYYDMTGNNVNHPNDFLARIYAQTVAELFLGEEWKI